MKIFTIQSQFLGEFTAKFKYSYSQEYSPQCESSIRLKDSSVYRVLRQDMVYDDFELGHD